MSNILNLPQVPAISFVLSQDSDWLDSIFFPADAADPPTPRDLSGIRFVAHFRTTSGLLLPCDTNDGSILNHGAAGSISFNSLVSSRGAVPVGDYVANLFAIADGYQIDLSTVNGPMSLSVKGDTL